MAGVPVALGVRNTTSKAICQVAGDAVRMDAGRFVEVLHGAGGTLLSLVLRYAQALQEQIAHSVACNRRHGIDERCARWLLMTRDRVESDQFVLTHEFLAFMLGVRRASVTVAAGMLQQAGLIQYSRGKITVLDAERLQEASCECYPIIRKRYDELLREPPATA